MNITIAIGADHRGYEMKQWLKNYMTSVSWIDVGTDSDERTDYPAFALSVIEKMQHGLADYGVMLCGTGIGMAIVANRFAGIYAGVVWNETLARLAKEDDNVNVLSLPADFISMQQAGNSINAWLCAEFKKGRYKKRIAMIDAIK